MFAYLLVTERKAYNPLSLNTGEQKNMAEFFIDLLSKTEEMTPKLKDVVKSTFCRLSNHVVSLDCSHQHHHGGGLHGEVPGHGEAESVPEPRGGLRQGHAGG